LLVGHFFEEKIRLRTHPFWAGGGGLYFFVMKFFLQKKKKKNTPREAIGVE
jgi:hypothetical protein